MNKNKEKNNKEKALVAYGRQYNGSCSKCGKNSHEPTDPTCQENKKKTKIKRRERTNKI